MFRLSLLLLLFSVASWSASVIVAKQDTTLYLTDNPLRLARELGREGLWEDVLLLTTFSARHLPEHEPVVRQALHDQAQSRIASPAFIARRFMLGAMTGEPVDTASLLGALSLDMFVIGDIRDLAVQGYREVSTGDGDGVVMALSATGLLLTLAPQLSWSPALLKRLYRSGSLSRPFMHQVETVTARSLKSGDVIPLRHVLEDFSRLVDGLGMGPSLAVLKRIQSTRQLELVSAKAALAPAEAYTLVRLAGPDSVKLIKKEGKLARRIRIGVRQQKMFGKLLLALPMSFLALLFTMSVGLILYLVIGWLRRRVERIDQ